MPQDRACYDVSYVVSEISNMKLYAINLLPYDL